MEVKELLFFVRLQGLKHPFKAPERVHFRQGLHALGLPVDQIDWDELLEHGAIQIVLLEDGE